MEKGNARVEAKGRKNVRGSTPTGVVDMEDGAKPDLNNEASWGLNRKTNAIEIVLDEEGKRQRKRLMCRGEHGATRKKEGFENKNLKQPALPLIQKKKGVH